MEPLLAATASGGVRRGGGGGGEEALLEGVAASGDGGDGDKGEEPHSERGRWRAEGGPEATSAAVASPFPFSPSARVLFQGSLFFFFFFFVIVVASDCDQLGQVLLPWRSELRRSIPFQQGPCSDGMRHFG